MAEEFNEVLDAVGARLRALRVERGATLAELAESTGISVSTLSRLESGQRKPTLELLLPLARAHHVALDELVDAPETGDPRVRIKPIKRHGRRSTRATSGSTSSPDSCTSSSAAGCSTSNRVRWSSSTPAPRT